MDGIQTDSDLIVALSKEIINSIKDYLSNIFPKTGKREIGR